MAGHRRGTGGDNDAGTGTAVANAPPGRPNPHPRAPPPRRPGPHAPPPPPPPAGPGGRPQGGRRVRPAPPAEPAPRRTGVIGGPTEWLASDARLAGHNAALADVGVLPSGELLRSVQPTTDHGHGAAASLLDRPERPTALVCFNDKA